MIRSAHICAAIISLALSGCYEPVIKNIYSQTDVSTRADGAIAGYYLPKSTWKFTANYDGSSGLLSLSADPKPAVQPDIAAGMFYLSYGHSGLSDDDITLQFDRLMLKTLASKTTDQTLKTAEAVNALLTEVGSTRTAIQKGNLVFVELNGNDKGPPKALKDALCTTSLKTEVVVDLSYMHPETPRDLLWDESCSLTISATFTRLGLRPFKTAADDSAPFGASQDLPQTEDICQRAVCFRPTQIVQVKVTAALRSNVVDSNGALVKDKTGTLVHSKQSNIVRVAKAGHDKPAPMLVDQTYDPVAVPSARGRAFVEFGRRAFVQNQTSLTFTDGVVSEFKSTDPSIIAGAVTLSSDLLKTVVLTVPLVR